MQAAQRKASRHAAPVTCVKQTARTFRSSGGSPTTLSEQALPVRSTPHSAGAGAVPVPAQQQVVSRASRCSRGSKKTYHGLLDQDDGRRRHQGVENRVQLRHAEGLPAATCAAARCHLARFASCKNSLINYHDHGAIVTTFATATTVHILTVPAMAMATMRAAVATAVGPYSEVVTIVDDMPVPVAGTCTSSTS